MCVCVYVCVYGCVDACVRKRESARARACVCVYERERVCEWGVYVRTCVLQVCICSCVSVNTGVPARAFVCASHHVCCDYSVRAGECLVQVQACVGGNRDGDGASSPVCVCACACACARARARLCVDV